MNEFETISAFTTLAGANQGGWTNREVAVALLKALDQVTEHDITKKLWVGLAEYDDQEQDIIEIQQAIVELFNDVALLPAYCHVVMENNEWRVVPYIDEGLQRVSEIPDDYIDDHILQVSDHGNVSCYEWNHGLGSYQEIWAMV